MPQMSEEAPLRGSIARVGASLFDRRLTAGSSGNISARLPDGGWLVTPTNVLLGALDPARLARFDAAGRRRSGDPPAKEARLHFTMHEECAHAGAVVHPHSTHSPRSASCAMSIWPTLCPRWPPLTSCAWAGFPSAPISRPAIPPWRRRCALAGRHHAVLLANQGPVVAGTSLETAQFAAEEPEETARLFLLLQNHAIRPLTPERVADLRARLNLG